MKKKRRAERHPFLFLCRCPVFPPFLSSRSSSDLAVSSLTVKKLPSYVALITNANEECEDWKASSKGGREEAPVTESWRKREGDRGLRKARKSARAGETRGSIQD
ncbi:hypothetical protein PUN28_001269 [Cardiocondyla obscurior]|uniref:Uncharacterized protein n=1 Tax=Cardiocondyla obscurior TaxID=286306 RepID=A0AAW2H4A1_9HYME